MKMHYVAIYEDDKGETKMSNVYTELWQAEVAAETILERERLLESIFVYEAKTKVFKQKTIKIQKEELD